MASMAEMDECVFQRTTDNYSVETFTKCRPDLGLLSSETKVERLGGRLRSPQRTR